jgi:beta-lactamase regulating signal transducer with metallopeptidase domain
MSDNAGELFLSLLRASAAGGVLVVVVLAAQWVFRKQLAPRWRCALWLLVVVRLLPVSFTSNTSLLCSG